MERLADGRLEHRLAFPHTRASANLSFLVCSSSSLPSLAALTPAMTGMLVPFPTFKADILDSEVTH